MLKKSIISIAMVGAVALALASSGGGDKKKSAVTPGINVLKTTPGFSLRAGRSYASELSLRGHSNSFALENTILAYRKGNTFYVLRSRDKFIKPISGRSNLNALRFNVNLRK